MKVQPGFEENKNMETLKEDINDRHNRNEEVEETGVVYIAGDTRDHDYTPYNAVKKQGQIAHETTKYEKAFHWFVGKKYKSDSFT